VAELPPSLQQSVQQALEPTERLLRIFVVPAQSFFKSWFGRRYVPPQALLFTPQGVLHVQEAATSDQPGRTIYLRAADLLYVQLRLLLLYGCLELVGKVNGTLTRVVVEFNTVGTWLLLPGLRRLLHSACGQIETEVSAKILSEVTLPEFQKLPLKFRNGLRIYGLQPDECLLGVIFQPGVWERRGRFFHHQVLANTLLALTDREVVIVEESRTGEKSPYGWILTFCPLTCVEKIEMTPGETCQELQLHLSRNGATVDRQVTLETEAVLAWQDLWTHRRVTES
jgi:hypothetical protein